jgi:hypothetical protein
MEGWKDGVLLIDQRINRIAAPHKDFGIDIEPAIN